MNAATEWHGTKERAVTLGRCLPSWLVLGWLVAACSTAHFPTLTVFETPETFVRLEVDRAVGPGNHNHPAVIPADRMAVVLGGIIVVEPATRLPLYDDLGIPRRHWAFDEEEIRFWAPLLTEALAKARPEEIVTFYRSRPGSGVRREVTSGGLYVVGDALHLVLSNYRAPTYSAADYGAADTGDDRLTPVRPIAPPRGTLEFYPPTARRSGDDGPLRRLFTWDRRELVIAYQALPHAPPETRPALPP